MEKLTKKLRSQRGDTLVFSLILLFVILLLAAFLFEFARVFIVKKGVRDTVTQAITANGAYNLYNAYDGLREENSATYNKPSKNDPWAAAAVTDDVTARLSYLIALQEESGALVKYAGDKLEFTLSNIHVTVTNPPVGSRTEQITYQVTYILTMPFSVGPLPPMMFNMSQQVVYRPKY